jgi:ABC-type branched-subunit amino acid transport system substrate-binding protein
MVLAACAAVGPRPESERAQYEAALALVARDPGAGAASLRAFIEADPRGPLADDAALVLARTLRQQGDLDGAERWLHWVMLNQPAGDRSDAARVELARVLQQRGDLDGAWRESRRARLSLLPEPERWEALRLIVDLAAARGDTTEQLIWLARARASASGEENVAAVDAEIDALLTTLSTEELERAALQLGRRAPAARVWMAAAEADLRAGDEPLAQRALERAARLPLTRAEAERLAQLEHGELGPAGAFAPGVLPPLGAIEALLPPPAGSVAGTLGVVLPLSGPLGRAGEETLRGVLLAADVFGGEPGEEGGLRILVRDSAGRPDLAAAGVRDLARQEGISAIVGPLLEEETQAAAVVAGESQVPLLALTRHEEVAVDQPEVFRLGLSRRMEAETLADHAVRELGVQRVAILYPRDGYGREFESRLWQAMEARGVTVVGVAGYDPEATDFAGPIRSLVGYTLLTPAEEGLLHQRNEMLSKAKRLPPEQARALREDAAALEAPGGGPLPPIVDFDALFIPDSHDKVVLIAPQLAFHEVRGVRLLGTSGWQDPDLIRIAGDHVEGAVFTSAFDPQHPDPLVREFTRRYVQTYGEEPGAFAAQGFDAANLALVQIVSGRAAPQALRAGLLDGRTYAGVSGVMTFDPDGNARKRPFLIEVERGQTVSVE